MTTLVPDPTDHWVDLDTTSPRLPLRREMWDAFNTAFTDGDQTNRAYWTGVGTGYAVAFGLFTRRALDRARLTPRAFCLNPLDPHQPADEDRAWASGVLYGYKQGTSERSDAMECLHCAERLTDDDEVERCEHGTFSPDCARDWHADVTGFCTYLDAS